jgi:hypothetical protein
MRKKLNRGFGLQMEKGLIIDKTYYNPGGSNLMIGCGELMPNSRYSGE